MSPFFPVTVTQVSPLLVREDAAATAVPAVRLDSYTPVLSDRAVAVRYGSRLLVLGKEAA